MSSPVKIRASPVKRKTDQLDVAGSKNKPSKRKSFGLKENKEVGDSKQCENVPGTVELELYQKKLVKSLVCTMIAEVIVLAATLYCLILTPWFSRCALYTDEYYHLDSVESLEPNYPFYIDRMSKCWHASDIAFCVDNTLLDLEELEHNVTCRCTDNHPTLNLWSVALARHDAFSGNAVAWPVRGLLSVAAFLKLILSFEYLLSLFMPTHRFKPNSYVIKFCANWLSGAFLLGCTIHIHLSDYFKMCNQMGLGYWGMIFALLMSIPSMIGVLISTGYYIHIRVLRLELKPQ